MERDRIPVSFPPVILPGKVLLDKAGVPASPRKPEIISPLLPDKEYFVGCLFAVSKILLRHHSSCSGSVIFKIRAFFQFRKNNDLAFT